MTDSTWGSATWGTATWADEDEVIVPVPGAPLEWRAVLLEGTDSSAWPRGLEAVIHFGNYGETILNDKRQLQRHGNGVVVEEISGLDGPDLQVDNQKSPDRDGEFPDIPYYSGRTITIRGYATALTLDRMRHLYSRIMDGFDYVQREMPLWIRWLDWRDNFISSDSLLDYEYDSGSGLTVASDGTGLAPTSTSMKSLRLYPTSADGSSPQRLTYGDGEAIIGFQAAVISGNQIGVEARRTASNNKLLVTFNHAGASASIRVYAVRSGGENLIGITPVDTSLLVAGKTYFLKVRFEGELITYSIWDFFPPDITTVDLPLISGDHTLAGTNLTDFPGLPGGQGWGLRWTPNSTSDRIQVFDVGSINKGDAVVFCRKASKIEGPEIQEGMQYKRNFLLTLRASDSRMVSRKVSQKKIEPSGSPVSTTYEEDEIVNLGRSPASIIVRFNGPVLNPRLEIVSQGVISVDYNIPEGEYIEVDTRRDTVVNQVRASRYSSVSDATDWPQLGPVTNVIRASSEIYDDFEDAADGSTLNGRSSPSSVSWSTNGDSPDFTANAAGEMTRSSETDTVAGRKALFGSDVYADTNVLMRYRFDPDEVETGFVDFSQGLMARYIDANNFLYVSHGERDLFIAKAVAGVGSYMTIQNTGSITSTLPFRTYTWLQQRLVVGSDGYGYVVIYDDRLVPMLYCPFYDVDLKTGEALGEGRVGILDRNGDGPNTRLYDDFRVLVALASGSIDVFYRHSSR